MHTLTISDLAIELHFAILDCLRGDRSALRACCLTSISWLDHAQQNLYYAVDIDVKNTAAFRRAIESRPDFSSYIRELTLNGVERIPKPPVELRPTKLKLLRLVGMDTSNPWVHRALSASKRSVQMLSLRDCHTEDIETFSAFLQGMPNLRHIDVEGGRLRESSPTSLYSAEADMSEVQSLALVGRGSYDVTNCAFVRALLACPDAYKNLSILKLRLETRFLPAFHYFLEVVGPGLRELDLGFDPFVALFGPSNFPLSLSRCRNLLLFNLELNLRTLMVPPNHLSYIPILLRSLQAPKLHRVKLVVHALRVGPEDLLALDWCSVGEILSEERFASLKRVLIHIVDGYRLWDMVVPFVEERLAGLKARGILRCKHDYDMRRLR